MLLSFIVFVIYLSFEKNKNKQKEAGVGPFLKKTYQQLIERFEVPSLFLLRKIIRVAF